MDWAQFSTLHLLIVITSNKDIDLTRENMPWTTFYFGLISILGLRGRHKAQKTKILNMKRRGKIIMCRKIQKEKLSDKNTVRKKALLLYS